jgi:Uma2 family endonuclease
MLKQPSLRRNLSSSGVTNRYRHGGVTRALSRIQGNLTAALVTKLRGKPCEFHGPELKIEVAGRIRYRDGFVTCSPGVNAGTVVQDAVVIFEIQSPSTGSVDRIDKNDEYRATASVQRYVMLEQDRVAATVFSRVGDDWIGHVYVGDAILAMPEIGLEVPLPELYEGLVFEEPDETRSEATV